MTSAYDFPASKKFFRTVATNEYIRQAKNKSKQKTRNKKNR